MSYLLDALKKAEQERKQGEQESLPLYSEPKVSAVLPGWLVVVLVLVLSLTIFKVLFSGGSSESSEVLVADDTMAPEVVAPAQENQMVQVPEDSPFTNEEVELKDLSELDGVTLGRIPSLSLESHIYSSASEYRSVIINGQSYGEGSLLAAGVVLDEITQTGIIIKVGEQYVVLPKGISWVSTNHAE